MSPERVSVREEGESHSSQGHHNWYETVKLKSIKGGYHDARLPLNSLQEKA